MLAQRCLRTIIRSAGLFGIDMMCHFGLNEAGACCLTCAAAASCSAVCLLLFCSLARHIGPELDTEVKE
eukprot:6007538-Amphidinium_carterae.1